MTKQYDNTDRGVLFRNDEKATDKHPDYSGSLNVGGAEFFLDAWINEAQSGRKFMSLKVKAKDKQPAQGKTHGQMRDERRRDNQDDDIPF
jgi:uncharacterized protein (DUF736 family)